MKILNVWKFAVWISLVLIIVSMMSASAIDFQVGQVRGHSNGGWGIADANITGLTPGATAYVALTGWSFVSNSSSQGNIGIWTQTPYGNNWSWGLTQQVDANGLARVRFIGLYNDQKPFDFLVNYLVIAQPSVAQPPVPPNPPGPTNDTDCACYQWNNGKCVKQTCEGNCICLKWDINTHECAKTSCY